MSEYYTNAEQHVLMFVTFFTIGDVEDRKTMVTGLAKHLADLQEQRADLLVRYEAMMEALGFDPSLDVMHEFTPDRLKAEIYGLRMFEERMKGGAA